MVTFTFCFFFGRRFSRFGKLLIDVASDLRTSLDRLAKRVDPNSVASETAENAEDKSSPVRLSPTLNPSMDSVDAVLSKVSNLH